MKYVEIWINCHIKYANTKETIWTLTNNYIIKCVFIANYKYEAKWENRCRQIPIRILNEFRNDCGIVWNK